MLHKVGIDDRKKRRESLCRALLSLRTAEECDAFLRDLCAEGELDMLAGRWLIARELSRGNTYREAARAADASTTTVTRVARTMRNESGGFRLILGRLLGRRQKASERDALPDAERIFY
jgi:TrpR-related protein YerC/YecD